MSETAKGWTAWFADLPTHRKRNVLLVGVPALVVAVGVTLWATGGRYVGTDNAYVKASRVQISADIEGRVVAVDVSENQEVDQGEPLFRIDPEPLEIAVRRAEADLADARAQIEVQQARARQKQEELLRAMSDAGFQERERNRQEALARRKVASAASLDAARNELDAANRRVEELRQELSALLAAIGGTIDQPVQKHPRYRAAEAAFDQARLDLDHAIVRAPAHGIVSQITNFRPGDYVTPGRVVFTLIETEAVWIEANMKETDLTHVREGQAVEITVDAYPGRTWHGTVTSLNAGTGAEFAILPPQNAVGNWVKIVQRVPVQVSIDKAPDDRPLRLGMSAAIEIDTGYTRLFRPGTAIADAPDESGAYGENG